METKLSMTIYKTSYFFTCIIRLNTGETHTFTDMMSKERAEEICKKWNLDMP